MNNAISFYEIWKPITRKSVHNIVENIYYISNFGRVISYAREEPRILNPVMTDNGYLRISLADINHNTRYYSIHRIVMIEFCYFNGCESLQVNHLDGNKTNNSLYNLQWVTPSKNIQHAYDNNLKFQYHGEDCSWCTVSNIQLEEICKLLLEEKYSHKEIANIVNCSEGVVRRLSCGSSFKDYYHKYNLDKIKKKYIIKFSNKDLHLLFKYFEENSKKYTIKSDLYRSALKDLFNINYTNNMSATLSRLYNRQTRTDISNQYIF